MYSIIWSTSVSVLKIYVVSTSPSFSQNYLLGVGLYSTLSFFLVSKQSRAGNSWDRDVGIWMQLYFTLFCSCGDVLLPMLPHSFFWVLKNPFLRVLEGFVDFVLLVKLLGISFLRVLVRSMSVVSILRVFGVSFCTVSLYRGVLICVTSSWEYVWVIVTDDGFVCC